MSETLKLKCILAHPDDESLGTGGILAKYAAEVDDFSALVQPASDWDDVVWHLSGAAEVK